MFNWWLGHQLITVSIDELVPKFQLNCIHIWHETSNWDSSSSDTESNPRAFYTAIDKDIIKEAKVNLTVCYFKYDKKWNLFCPHCQSFLLRHASGKLHLVASDKKKKKRWLHFSFVRIFLIFTFIFTNLEKRKLLIFRKTTAN